MIRIIVREASKHLFFITPSIVDDFKPERYNTYRCTLSSSLGFAKAYTGSQNELRVVYSMSGWKLPVFVAHARNIWLEGYRANTVVVG